MTYEIVEKIKKQIDKFSSETELQNVGFVVESSDGIAKISGLSDTMSQELLIIEAASGDVNALAFNLEENFIGAVILASGEKVSVGNRVRKTGKVLSVQVGEDLIGRVVDPLINPLDGKGIIFKDDAKVNFYELERRAPSVVERKSVHMPLHTGIKSIDAMIPIGRGQRELIIGDRQTGKTAIALDAILNQKNDIAGKKVICIYVAIGQKDSGIARTIKMLSDRDAMKYTIIVSAPASSPTAIQYLAPFSGCAIGEYFMDKGEDVLIIYDDLSKHAIAYREMSLLLRRPPGREAYPGDVFYLHARLLERSACLDEKRGGGTMTALPIIETQLGDVSSYIPTNVISITDGQIYLESSLFHQGVRPAVNVGLSVSRVGSAAQTKAMKKVSDKLRLELAQFREFQAFVQFASDLDENTKKRIKRGELLVDVLKQRDQETIPFEKQVIILFAAINGFLDEVSISDISDVCDKLVDYIEKMRPEILSLIVSEKDINADISGKLSSYINEFKNTLN